MSVYADQDCNICKGSGIAEVTEKEIDGEIWFGFIDCDCTIKKISPEMKAKLEKLREEGKI